MESKQKSGESTKKNFLKPEVSIDQVMNKREQFAVSLRKEKTRAIIQ